MWKVTEKIRQANPERKGMKIKPLSEGAIIKNISFEGTLIHTAVEDNDDLWLYLINKHTSDVDVLLTVKGAWGEYFVSVNLPYGDGSLPVHLDKVPGGSAISAKASISNKVSISGMVKVIS